MNLDAYDRKILFALDQNARESYIQLAKKSGLSKDSVKYRINNYLKNSLLGGFYALIDSSKLGYYAFRVYFLFKNTTHKDEKIILEYLKNQKRVFYLFRVEGNFDVGLGYFAKSLKEFSDFITQFGNKFSKVEIFKEELFVSLYHFDRNYLINKKRIQIPKEILQEPREIKLDKIDLELLKMISNNARIKIIDMCEKLNLTSKAVIYRLKNLEKNKVIIGYKAKLNLEKINYSMYKTDFIIRNKKIIKDVESYILQLPNIIHMEKVLGGLDLEFDIECRNYKEFKKILDDIKEHFGREIEKISYYRTTEIIKTTYFPEK